MDFRNGFLTLASPARISRHQPAGVTATAYGLLTRALVAGPPSPRLVPPPAVGPLMTCTDKVFRLLARIKDVLMLEHEEGRAVNEAERKALEALEAAERKMLHVEHEMEGEMAELSRDIAKAEEVEKKLAAPGDGTEAW